MVGTVADNASGKCLVQALPVQGLSQAAAAHWGGSVLLTCATYFGQPFARVDVIISIGHNYGGQPLT
jgi:hypothetical protein